MGKLLRLVQIYHVGRWMGGKKHVELNFFWPVVSLVMRLLVLSLVSLYFALEQSSFWTLACFTGIFSVYS